MTQGAFIHLIEARLLRKVDPQKGRFRSFLLGCFNLFLASETDRAQARKRGGGTLMLPIDVSQAERRLAAAPESTASPEELFDRHWAVAVLDAALARLEAEMRESGCGALFEQLLPSLQGDDDLPRYADIARRLETTEGTIKVTVHRLRRRYRELVRGVVSQTVNNPLDVETELAHLMAALRG